MKNIIFLILFISFIGYSQVGVGTTAPDSTLDIVATNQTGASTDVDGILIPRVDRQRAQSMTGTIASTMVFVNSIATGSAAGTAINITSTGFYYYDGVVWQKIATGASVDWALSGNTGTSAGTNFIGTTDGVDLRIKTGGSDRWNISDANIGQLQSYSLGTAGIPTYSFQADQNTGIFSPTADNISLTTNGTEGFRMYNAGNVTIGTSFASANAAPANGIRVEGKSIIGKASGEDSRDYFSSHTSTSAYNNVTGYPSATASRAIAGYADSNGMGIFGVSNRGGYGVVGLTQANTLSAYIQTGEGVLGQADGASGIASIPIGVHGIIDESSSGIWQASGVVGENNNLTTAGGLAAGSYLSAGAASGVYGDYASRFATSTTDRYVFGVVGDILLLGAATIPDASGGVLGTNGAGGFGIIGYKSRAGTNYSVYGGGYTSNVASGNTGRLSAGIASNRIGLGINGGFMGGYVRGSHYGLMTKGEEFGMYVEGKTITNEPIIQLSSGEESKKIITYTATSTEVDITTRGSGQLINGETFISFKEAFKNLVSLSEPINITVTPTAETKGVYINRVTPKGFYVKENSNGTSNAPFSWVAIGTRKGYENGIAISETITNPDFEKNMNEVMNNDGEKEEGKPVYFDGTTVKFERMPENLEIKLEKKTTKK